jgi:outer membrane cobalamin receptor
VLSFDLQGMKVYITLLLCMLSFLGGTAQKPNRVSGKAADSLTQQVLPFVTASLVNDQQVTIKNVISDSLGQYVLTGIPAGKYTLLLQAVGYNTFTSHAIILTDSTRLNLGLQLLSRDTGALTAVTVKGSKPLVSSSVDGFIYHAADDIIAAGTTASDLLGKIPLLTVSQDGSPMLRGSSHIRVFIDDKPSAIYAASVADALKQIPAEDILRIEVILYPSAKYDAEGTDGVINIVTRKNRFNAVNGNLRTRTGNIDQQFTPDLNIRNGNWVFNINAGVSHYRRINYSTLNREAVSDNEVSQLQQQSQWTNQGKIFYTGAYITYIINDLHNISGGYRYRVNRDHNDRSAVNNYYQHDSLFTAFTRYTASASGNDLQSFNLDYSGKSRDRKRDFSLLAFYFTMPGTNEYNLDQVREEAVDYKELLRGRTTNKELSLQADYVQRMNDSLTWDVGAKSAFRDFAALNNFSVYDFPSGAFGKDENRSNSFNYHRAIHAVYSNLTVRYRSWQVRVGARYEQTVLQVGFKDSSLGIPDYKNFVPSFLLSKTLDKKQVLKWSYSRRIARPMDNANPAINYVDSFNLQSGNPDLQPEVIHRYEIGYSFNAPSLSVMASLYYNSTHNAIEQVRLPLDKGIFLNTFQNIGRNDALGLSLSFTKKWQQKLTLTATVNLRRSYLKSVALQRTVTAYQYGTNFNLSYRLNKGYSLEALGNLNSPDIALQGKRDVWKYYALMLNKQFTGGKFVMSIRIENFLSSSIQYLRQDWSSPAFSQVLRLGYQNRSGFLSASWKLGKKEVKAPPVRQGEN